MDREQEPNLILHIFKLRNSQSDSNGRHSGRIVDRKEGIGISALLIRYKAEHNITVLKLCKLYLQRGVKVKISRTLPNFSLSCVSNTTCWMVILSKNVSLEISTMMAMEHGQPWVRDRICG